MIQLRNPASPATTKQPGKTEKQLIEEYIKASEALSAAEARVDEDAKLTKATLIERQTFLKASEALAKATS